MTRPEFKLVKNQVRETDFCEVNVSQQLINVELLKEFSNCGMCESNRTGFVVVVVLVDCNETVTVSDQQIFADQKIRLQCRLTKWSN
jgi:hypothetical protein